MQESTVAGLAGRPALTKRQVLGRYALLLGKAARRGKAPGVARRFLQVAWHLAPQLPELYVELGRCALGEWELARAERCFARASALDPASDEARLGRAEILLRRGRIDGARAAIEGVLAADAEDFDALVLRGEVFLARQDYRSAQDTFLVLTRQRPASSRPWRGLGLAYLGRGDRNNAARCIATAW